MLAQHVCGLGLLTTCCLFLEGKLTTVTLYMEARLFQTSFLFLCSKLWQGQVFGQTCITREYCSRAVARRPAQIRSNVSKARLYIDHTHRHMTQSIVSRVLPRQCSHRV